MAAKISWVGATTPPGLFTRSTIALTAGFSACSRSSRTAEEPSTMMPSISTTATRGPPFVADRVHEHPHRADEEHEDAHGHPHHNDGDAAARRHGWPRTPRLLLVVLVVVAAAALAAALAAPASLVLRLFHDGGGEILEAQPDAALVGLHADGHEGELVTH